MLYYPFRSSRSRYAYSPRVLVNEIVRDRSVTILAFAPIESIERLIDIPLSLFIPFLDDYRLVERKEASSRTVCRRTDKPSCELDLPLPT